MFAMPGFQETGFICMVVWAVRSADFISFFLVIQIIWSHFDSMFKNWGGGGQNSLWILGAFSRTHVIYMFLLYC